MLNTRPERKTFFKYRILHTRDGCRPFLCSVCVPHILFKLWYFFWMFVPYVWGASLLLFISISIPPSQRIRLSFLTLVNLSFHTSKSVCVWASIRCPQTVCIYYMNFAAFDSGGMMFEYLGVCMCVRMSERWFSRRDVCDFGKSLSFWVHSVYGWAFSKETKLKRSMLFHISQTIRKRI